jgi:hypothetical protein
VAPISDFSGETVYIGLWQVIGEEIAEYEKMGWNCASL